MVLNVRVSVCGVLFGGSDLEGVIEEIRKDVVGRRCRVNITEVEKLALALSHLSRSLASLKGLSFVPFCCIVSTRNIFIAFCMPGL